MHLGVAIQSQIREVLEQFNELVSTKNLQILVKFAPSDDILLEVAAKDALLNYWGSGASQRTLALETIHSPEPVFSERTP